MSEQLSPSAGTPEEGGGGGSRKNIENIIAATISSPNPHANPPPAYRWRGTILSLLLILALAAAVRCYNLGGKSLWLDEFFSLECSAGWARTDLHLPHDASPAPDLISLRDAKPWWTIWSSVAADENHPPLYFILLRGWRELFGDSASALRSLSVAASLASISLLFAIAMTISGRTVAISAAALMALAWPQIQRAQDARPYALLTTVALAGVLALVRIEKLGVNWRRVASLGIAALLMPLVHYLAFTALAAMAIYAIISLRGSIRAAILLCIGSALIIYALVWGPHLLGQHQAMIDRTAWLADDADHLRNTLARLALVPVRMFIQPDAKSGVIACVGGITLLAPLLAVRRNPQVLLWWLWIIVPVATALLLDLHYGRASLGNTKYTTLAEPAAYLLIGMLAASIKRFGWLLPVALCLSCALCLPNVYQPEFEEADWRPMAALLRSVTSPGDPIVLIDHSPNWPAGYFLVGLQYYLPDRPRSLRLIDGVPPAALLQSVSDGSGRIAIVGDGDDLEHLNLPVGAKFGHGEFFANLAVVGVVELRSSTSQPNQHR